MFIEYAVYLAVILGGTLTLKAVFGIQWPSPRLIRTLVPVAAGFIAWDVLAVMAGHWSFNPAFLLGIFLANQPVEEIAFFFIVPLFYVTVWEACKRQTQNRPNEPNKTGKTREGKQRSNAKTKPEGGRRR